MKTRHGISVLLAALGIWSPSAQAACTLQTNWEDTQTLGIPGGKQLQHSSVVHNPSLNRLFLGAYSISTDVAPATYELNTAKFEVYIQNAGGKFVLDYTYDPGPGRDVNSGHLSADKSGYTWLSLNTCDTTQNAISVMHGCEFTILKRSPSGVWSNAYTAPTTNTYVTPIFGAVARIVGGETEVWTTNATFDPIDPLDPYNPAYQGYSYKGWAVYKWTASAGMVKMDVMPFTGLSDDNAPDPTFIRIAPNGRVWIGARVEDANDDVHAILQEEDASAPSGFTVMIDYRKDPVASKPGDPHDTWDRFRDVAFDDVGNYYLTHTYQWTPVTQDYVYAQLFKGPVSNPGAYTILEDQNNYFAGGQTMYFGALWHQNSELFIAGEAWNLPDSGPPTQEMTFVRRGGASGPFVNSGSGYEQGRSGADIYGFAYAYPILVTDGAQNIWHVFSTVDTTDVSYQGPSASYGSWNWGANGQVLVRKLACL